jgi:hypothetical protein
MKHQNGWQPEKSNRRRNLMTIAETEPTLWKPGQTDNARLRRELESCEKKNRSLTELVHHIGEAVIRHVKGNK